MDATFIKNKSMVLHMVTYRNIFILIRYFKESNHNGSVFIDMNLAKAFGK